MKKLFTYVTLEYDNNNLIFNLLDTYDEYCGPEPYSDVADEDPGLEYYIRKEMGLEPYPDDSFECIKFEFIINEKTNIYMLGGTRHIGDDKTHITYDLKDNDTNYFMFTVDWSSGIHGRTTTREILEEIEFFCNYGPMKNIKKKLDKINDKEILYIEA